MGVFSEQLSHYYNIQTALGTEEGLKAISTGTTFAVVVTDLRDPQMSGREFLAEARSRCPYFVNVILGGTGETEMCVTQGNENILHVLSSPFPVSKLREALDAALVQFERVVSQRALFERSPWIL